MKRPAPQPTVPKPTAMPAARTAVAVIDRPAAADMRPPIVASARRSEHLLDLKSKVAAADAAEPIYRKPATDSKAATGAGGKMRRLFENHAVDEALACSLSARPHGWNDFPPAEARSFGHAIALTIKNTINEHPLADLTVIAVVRLTSIALWRIVSWPVRRMYRRLTTKKTVAVPPAAAVHPLLPLMPLPKSAKPSATTAMASRTEATPVPAKRRLTLAWTKRQRLYVGASASAVLITAIATSYGLALLRNKDFAMAQTAQGAENLVAAASAVQSTDFAAASAKFDQAALDFKNAERSLGVLGNFALSVAALLPTTTKLSSADAILVAGREIGLGGSDISHDLIGIDDAKDPAAKITLIRNGLAAALPHFDRASAAIAKIDPRDVPEQYRDRVTAAKEAAPKLSAGARRAADIVDLLAFLGGTKDNRRFLLIFQNNAELRATGGFIGSFALIDAKAGKISLAEMPGGGSYDLRGGMREQLVSPQPLHLINPNWEFQDANWYADYPTSAKQLSWFYEKSGGPTVDSVIAMTMSFMERLLDVTGPVEMPAYGVTVDARNFYFTAQKQSEIDYDKAANKPKQFLADLAPVVIDRVMNADRAQLIKLAGSLDQSLGRKEVLLWFRDDATERKAAALGWNGELAQTDGDYLSLVHTNIAGAKTDLMMEDKLSHAVKVLPDGTGIVTLTLKRTHRGVRDALFSGVRNVDYLRVYVPSGSTLVEAKGFNKPDPKLFKIPDANRQNDPQVAAIEAGTTYDHASGAATFTESGKTVFGGWIQTDPGQTSSLTLVYKLPPGVIKVRDVGSASFSLIHAALAGNGDEKEIAYSLLVQKQPGAKAAAFSSSLDLPRGYRPVWQSPERTADETGRWNANTDLERDRFLAAVARAN